MGGHYQVSGSGLEAALEEFDSRIKGCREELAAAQAARDWKGTREAAHQLSRLKAERGITECGFWRAEAQGKRISGTVASIAVGLGLGLLVAWLVVVR